MKTVTLTLTDEQAARFQTIATALGTTPELVIPSLALQDLDGCTGGWAEWGENFESGVEFYMKEGHATDGHDKDLVEDDAPQSGG